MAASENKTKPTPESVDAFLETIPDATKRSDCQRLRELMESVTGEEGMLWGPSMVGFGTYHYRYASGHEGDSMAVGFALRSANITLYTTGGIGGVEDHEPVLQRLGRYKTGKGFLSIKRLSDVDEDTLTDLITASVTTAAEVNVNLARAVIRTHDLDTGRVARLGRGLTSGRGVIVAQTVVCATSSFGHTALATASTASGVSLHPYCASCYT